MSNKNGNGNADWQHNQSNQSQNGGTYTSNGSFTGGSDGCRGSLDCDISSDKRKPATPVPQIKILSQQFYEPVRVDPELRENLHKKYGNEPLLLIFDSYSCEKLKDYIGWGHQTSENRVEQGGILLGRVHRYKSEIFSFVEDCILANTRGSATAVEFTPDMWSKMQYELDVINIQREKNNQIAIIGWFHIHPNGLPVFMSGTDRNTQDKNFSQDWQVSVVLNPHIMKLKAFFGKEIRDGRIVGWDDRPLPRPNEYVEPAPVTKQELTGDPNFDAEISGLQKKIENYEERIAELKKLVRVSTVVGLCFFAIFLLTGFIAGNLLQKASNPVDTKETPTSQTSPTIEPKQKKTSPVLFSIIFKKWTSSDTALSCDIMIEGTTTDALTYINTQSIKCNSDEAYIELEAGTYTITFSNFPKLTDGLVFNDVEPITVTVDGTNLKRITVELETKLQEPTTSEPVNDTTEDESATSSTQPELSTNSKPSASGRNAD